MTVPSKLKTRAAVLPSPDGLFEVEDISLNNPNEHEILVEIEACGVCHTDAICKHIVPTPSVLGHEGVGIVKAIGKSVTSLKVGDRVLLCYPFCGICYFCKNEEPYNCIHNAHLSFSGSRLDDSKTIEKDGVFISSAFFQQSSFANHAIAPALSAVKVPHDIPANILAALPCGIATGAGAILNTFKMQQSHQLLIFGAGAVGLSAVAAASQRRVKNIVAIDLNEERLEKAKSFGATSTFLANSIDLTAQLEKITPNGFSHILDTSSSSSAWQQSLSLLSPGGKFGFVSVPQPFDEFTIKPIELMFKGSSITAIVQGSANSQEFIPKLIDWWRDGKLPVEKIIGDFAFDKINEAFQASHSGEVVKPILHMKSQKRD